MGSFADGMRMGQGAYQQMLDNQQREKEFGLRQEAHTKAMDEADLRLAALRRQDAKDASDRAALANLTDTVQNGPVTQNTTGFSNPSAGMIYAGAGGGAAGQQALDDAASYGNVENVRFGLGAKKFNTSTPASPVSNSVPDAAAGLPAPSAPAGNSTFARTSGPLTARQMNQAAMLYHIATGAVDKAQLAKTADRGFAIQEIDDRVGKMSNEELKQQLLMLNTEKLSHIPVYHNKAEIDPKTKKPTGYNTISIADPVTGEMTHVEMTPAQTRQFVAGSLKMAGGFGTEGVTQLSGISDKLDDVAGKLNANLKGVVDTNNTSQNHYVTGKAATTSADAAASRAATDARLATSVISERDARNKRESDAFAEIHKVLPEFAKIKDKKSPEAQALLSDAVLAAAAKSGDVSKLMMALKDRVTATGRKPIGKIEKTDAGVLVFDTDNNLMEFLTPSGLSLPPGLTEEKYDAALKAAANAGVPAGLGRDPATGDRVLGYKGKSGEDYLSLAEAIADRRAPAGSAANPEALPPRATGLPSAPEVGIGTISVNRNPNTGKTIFTVEGLRGRFSSKADAEQARTKAGIGLSPMSRSLAEHGD